MSILGIIGLVSYLEERDRNGIDELRERNVRNTDIIFLETAYRPLYSLDSSSEWRDGYACNGLSDALMNNLVSRLLSPWHERVSQPPSNDRCPLEYATTR